MSEYVTVAPWRIRWHLWRTGHLLATYNPFMTMALGDSSRGIFARCDCGKEWAL